MRPRSATQRSKNVVCTSADLLSAIIDPGAYDVWKSEGTQGWTFIVTLPGTVNQAPANGVADNPDVADDNRKA